jgi:formylglycine-generating enzyme required for sulfatase activity
VEINSPTQDKLVEGSAPPGEPPAESVVWIPGGTFLMGSDRHYPDEAPAHKATVNGFWMDRHTVTNREFKRFVEATGHVTLAERPANAADYPGLNGPDWVWVGRLTWRSGTSAAPCKLS